MDKIYIKIRQLSKLAYFKKSSSKYGKEKTEFIKRK